MTHAAVELCATFSCHTIPRRTAVGNNTRGIIAGLNLIFIYGL